MTDFEKLRSALLSSLTDSNSLFCHRAFGTYGCAEGRTEEDCCKPDAMDRLMATILAALQEPMDVMIKAAVGDRKNGLQLVAEGFWKAMLNASPLVKPEDKT